MKIIKFYVIFIFLAVILRAPAKAGAVYDLKAESLTMNSSGCEVNQVCVFTARVKNLGAAFTLDFPIKGAVAGSNYQTDSPTTVSPASGTAVKTNDYITFTVYGRFAKIGQTTLTFSVDAAGYLNESDISNNSVSLNVNVTGYDLAVDSLTVYPAAPMTGQTCYILARIKNNSSYKLYSGAGLDLVKILPDFSLVSASSTAPSLANVIDSGGYLYYGYEGKFTAAGEKQLSFTIDPNDALNESDKTNNFQTLKLAVFNPADADLAIDSVSFSAAKIILGQPFDVTVGIKNTGKASLTGALGFSQAEFNFSSPHFDYGINDLTHDDYPSLTSAFNPGDVFHYKLRGAFNQPGKYSLAFAVNKSRDLTEADYSNDATTTPVTVYKSQSAADDFSVLSKTVSFASSTTALVSWTTDQPTAGSVNYNQAGANVNDHTVSADNGAALTAHSVAVDNLLPGEKYDYAIVSANGSVTKTEIISNFTMPPDNILKIIAGPSLAAGDKAMTLSWTTNLNSVGYVYYKKHGGADITAAGSAAMVAGHNVILNNLNYGAYDYWLSSTSTPGTNVKTGWANFEVKAEPATSTAAIAAINGAAAAASLTVISNSLYNKLRGKIILKVQDKGQAYYVSPKEKKIFYLGRPTDAFAVIRAQGVGASNADLAKIPVSLDMLSGPDSDHDGLPDAFEDAIGTNKTKADTDGDGHDDKTELLNGYSPLAKEQKLNYDLKFSAAQKGRILLQTQSRGQAWYINPADGKRYFLARPEDAFNLMRRLGVGVSNGDWQILTGK